MSTGKYYMECAVESGPLVGIIADSFPPSRVTPVIDGVISIPVEIPKKCNFVFTMRHYRVTFAYHRASVHQRRKVDRALQNLQRFTRNRRKFSKWDRALSKMTIAHDYAPGDYV